MFKWLSPPNTFTKNSCKCTEVALFLLHCFRKSLLCQSKAQSWKSSMQLSFFFFRHCLSLWDTHTQAHTQYTAVYLSKLPQSHGLPDLGEVIFVWWVLHVSCREGIFPSVHTTVCAAGLSCFYYCVKTSSDILRLCENMNSSVEWSITTGWGRAVSAASRGWRWQTCRKPQTHNTYKCLIKAQIMTWRLIVDKEELKPFWTWNLFLHPCRSLCSGQKNKKSSEHRQFYHWTQKEQMTQGTGYLSGGATTVWLLWISCSGQRVALFHLVRKWGMCDR